MIVKNNLAKIFVFIAFFGLVSFTPQPSFAAGACTRRYNECTQAYPKTDTCTNSEPGAYCDWNDCQESTHSACFFNKQDDPGKIIQYNCRCVVPPPPTCTSPMTYQQVREKINSSEIITSIDYPGGRATITNNTDCSFPAGLAIYKMATENDPPSEQVFFSKDGPKTSQARSTLTFQSTLPGCYFQLDLGYGNPSENPNDTVGNFLAGGRYTVGLGSCFPPPPPPPPPISPMACTLGSATPVGFEARYLVNFTPNGDNDYMVANDPSHYFAPAKSLNLPAGNYRVTLMSWDNHADKKACYESGGCSLDQWQQSNERYYLGFANSGGNWLTISGDTPDLGNDSDSLTAVVDTNLPIPAGVASIQPWHSVPRPDSPNSIYGICAALDKIYPSPSVDIAANNSQGPITVPYNSSVKLEWYSLNSSSCTASGSWSGTKTASDSWSREDTPYLTSPATYTITCSGQGGTASDSVIVNVSSPPEQSVNNASCTNINAPVRVEAGKPFAASVSMQNTGTKAWAKASDITPHRLGSQNPQDNLTWGLSRVDLPSEPINPGQTATFNFNATAPTTPGPHNFDWKMLEEGGSTWYLKDFNPDSIPLGQVGDVLVPGDYIGDDNNVDLAVARKNGDAWNWYIQGADPIVYASSKSIPVPADYIGDKKTDIAVVYDGGDGAWDWYIRGLADPIRYASSLSTPVPADYNGDGKADIAVVYPVDGVWNWYIRGIADPIAYGATDSIPVPADYNGDGKADIAVWWPNNGTWYVRGLYTLKWGTEGDIPVPGDYNGGQSGADFGVFRPSDGKWYVFGIPVLQDGVPWGAPTDIPVPADYNGDGKTDIAVWRPSTETASWFGATCSKNINIIPNSTVPTLSLTASQPSVSYSTPVTVIWDSENANSCSTSEGSPGWAKPSRPVDGTWLSQPLVADSSYTATCSGFGASVTKSVTVKVDRPLPNVNIRANPPSVSFDQKSNLSWTSTEAIRCSATGGPWSGDKEVNGSEETTNLRTNTTYEITCWNRAGDSDVDSVTIAVTSATLSADLKVNLGGGYLDSGSGVWPLMDVDLKATTGGSAAGDIIYKFWCDTRDSAPTITETVSTNAKPHIQEHINLCDYNNQGRYFAKLEVTRSGINAVDTAEILVARACAISP